MSMMSYDWRLGYDMMEKRDGLFTKLKMTVEAHYITSGEKVVIVSHRYDEVDTLLMRSRTVDNLYSLAFITAWVGQL